MGKLRCYDSCKDRYIVREWFEDVLQPRGGKKYLSVCMDIFDLVMSRIVDTRITRVQGYGAAVLLYCVKFHGLNLRLTELADKTCGAVSATELVRLEQEVLSIIWALGSYHMLMMCAQGD